MLSEPQTVSNPVSPPFDKVASPLVTFAIFTFNQEAYVRQAVEAALDQDYEPLEVIISDDCSTDSTFSILLDIRKNYKGSKRLIVRQTSKNRGTLLHLQEVALLAQGDLLVLGAGDDVSLPERTKTLVSAWRQSGAWGFSSRFHRLSETGKILSRCERVELFFSKNYQLKKYFAAGRDSLQIIHGATSAYDRRIFAQLKLSDADYILSEDGVLTVLLHLLSKPVVFLEDALVLYRESPTSLTNASRGTIPTKATLELAEDGIRRFARSQANRCRLFLKFVETIPSDGERSLDAALLRKELRLQDLRANWPTLNLTQKIQHLLSARAAEEWIWWLPRLLPKSIFIELKLLVKKFKSSRHKAQRLYS